MAVTFHLAASCAASLWPGVQIQPPSALSCMLLVAVQQLLPDFSLHTAVYQSVVQHPDSHIRGCMYAAGSGRGNQVAA